MNLKIFTKDIEDSALEQINILSNTEAFKDAKIRIMPDVHAGSGCVIGFTADLGNKVVPNIVGVDIGCGMSVYYLGQIEINYKLLDDYIKENIPSGMEVNEIKTETGIDLKDLICYDQIKNVERAYCSIGTLGGGNHFIEIDKDKDNNKYLIIHSGSRNLGLQVANIYQNLAISLKKTIPIDDINKIIKDMKLQGREREIGNYLKEYKKNYNNSISIPDELCYLEKIDRDNYLHDMKLCQKFAVANRKEMVNRILKFLNITYDQKDHFETIHNYIDDRNIIRKGAVSAHKGERLVIPMNMRDGCIIAIGKGNPDWNESAPHGAGRLLSRTKAKQDLSLNEFTDSMKGIFTTTAVLETIDESPMAYKSMDEIINCIEDTVSIEKIIKPVYNFKAANDAEPQWKKDKKRKA